MLPNQPRTVRRFIDCLVIRLIAVSIVSAALAGCQPGGHRGSVQFSKSTYPPARKDAVTDTYFGVKVKDPYRWLENPDSNETLGWVEKQNSLTEEFFSMSARDQIKARLTHLWNYPKYSAPYKKDSRYFFWKNDGLQNQYVFYTQRTLTGESAVVINPNLLSEDGTIAVGATALSYDGTLFAYGLSEKGSDRQQIKVRKVDSLEDYNDLLKWCRWPDIAWKHDNTGFYYDRFPEPNTVAPEDQFNYNRVYYHTLATPQAQDTLVYEQPENKELGFSPVVTEDDKFLVLYVGHGTDPNNRIYYRPAGDTGPFIKLLNDADAHYGYIGNLGSTFYFRTNLDAPRGRIIAIDINNPARENWREIISQTNDVIDYVGFVNNHFVVVYMKDVHNQVKIYNLEGAFVREIPLPSLGTVGGLSGNQFDTEMFFTFTSFLFPPTVYRYDFAADNLSVFRAPQIDFDASPYETRQIFYNSKDGTRVAMFITSKKGLVLDGNNATLLYGYGGFNISIKPGFSIPVLVWLEQGGVYAVANIRGGGEYGENWHRAGMLDKKQNVFDDFTAAAEFLIKNDYTNPHKLAIAGGSNGGLLTAACMLRKPQLFGAVVSSVPVTDMLRFQKFTVGRYWVPEYGNAEADINQFKYLYAYSPLHNIRRGVEYPPILVTSADTDDRVVPAHAKKFVATLQEKDAEGNPILLRVETKAGHGPGKPTSKIIDDQAEMYAFIFKTLNVPYRAVKN